MQPLLKKTIILFCLMVLGSLDGYGQTSFDTLNAYLRNKHFDGPIAGKFLTTKIVDLPEELRCGKSNQNYIWYRGRLIIQIDGSGKILEKKPDANAFVRIDSTCYEGNSFGAFTFTYNDTLFSLGGYGFWSFNGMLRYYDEVNRQWSVLSSNKNLPLKRSTTANFYYDKEHAQIFVIYQVLRQLNEDESVKIDPRLLVQALDLKTKKWWNHPKIIKEEVFPKSLDIDLNTCFHTKFGLLTAYNDDIYLIDFKNNLFIPIAPSKKADIFNKMFSLTEWMLFTNKDSLYFYDVKKNDANVIFLQEKDLDRKNGKAFYTNQQQNILMESIIPTWLVLIVFVCMMAGAFLVYKHYKNNKRMVENANNRLQKQIDSIIKNTSSFQDNLTNSELLLFNLLIENTTKNIMTSINNINHALGIAQKPLKIQNNIRATNIQMINKKFMVFSGCNDELIQKERTEFDKRIFEYAIQKKYLHKLK